MTPFLTAQPHAIRGGPAIQHLGFLRHLRGFAPHVVIPIHHELEEEYRAVAAGVLHLKRMRTIPRTLSPLAFASYLAELASSVRQLARYGRGAGAQLVHTFNEAWLAGPLAARALGVPSVLHVIGMSIFQPEWMARWYVRLVNATCDRIVCCQGAAYLAFAKLGVPERKLSVVYNSVDGAAIRERARREPAPPREHGTFRIGMLAGLDPRKGHLGLVEAAARVCARRPDARFFAIGNMAGSGDYRLRLERAVAAAGLKDKFILVGATEYPAAWLASLDIYCISSQSEGLSVAGLEAMALGRPTVATSVGGNTEAVENGVTGILVRPGDPEQLADAILELMADAGRRSAMGEAAQSRVEERFSLEANSRRLSDIFSELGCTPSLSAGPGTG